MCGPFRWLPSIPRDNLLIIYCVSIEEDESVVSLYPGPNGRKLKGTLLIHGFYQRPLEGLVCTKTLQECGQWVRDASQDTKRLGTATRPGHYAEDCVCRCASEDRNQVILLAPWQQR